MFGVWGILLAIPLTAIADFVYDEMVLARLEERRKNRQETDQGQESKTMMQSIRQGINEVASGLDSEVRDDDSGQN